MYLEVSPICRAALKFAAAASSCTVFLALSVCGEARAASYFYDFSEMGLAAGQDLEGMMLDLATFTAEAADLQYHADYGGGIGTAYAAGGVGDIYIDFSAAVHDITFTGGDGAGDLDAFAVTLYEFETDALIGTWSTPQFGGPNEPEWYTLTIPASDVGRVVFDPGNSGVLPGTIDGAGGLVIVEMSYVPEPSTAVLFGLGLAVLPLVRRGKQL